MKTSPAGRALIERREGRRLSAYRDGVGVLTIGCGHTGRMSAPPVHAGMTITDAECSVYLAADLAPVEHVISAAVKVPITQNEFDALTSLGFNIGAGGLRGSLTIRKLNRGDVKGAAAAFMDWAHPVQLAGRRREEMAQFLEPDPDGARIVADRAAVLTHKATVKKASAKKTAAGGAALATAGALAAVAVPFAHHGHLGWWVGGLAAVSAAVDGAVAWNHHSTATTLATNAATHARPATAPSPPATSATSQSLSKA